LLRKYVREEVQMQIRVEDKRIHVSRGLGFRIASVPRAHTEPDQRFGFLSYHLTWASYFPSLGLLLHLLREAVGKNL
jgi:hypothetical protein